MGRTSFALEGAAPGMSKLAAALMGNAGGEQAAYDDTMLKQTKIGAMLAQMKAQQASAAKDEAETGILTRRPDLYEEQVALGSGTDLPMVQKIRQMAAGAPETQMGPATEDGQMGRVGLPINADQQSKVVQQLQRLAPMLFNKGDITMDSMAKAAGAYADQDRDAQGFAGTVPAAQLEAYRQYEMAKGGKDRYSMGPEGRLDQFGGGVDTSAPTTQATIGLRGAQAGAQKANAVQSYASAGASNASAAKTRSETGRGTYDSSRGVVVDERAGTYKPVVGTGGQSLPVKTGKGTAMSATAQKELFEAEDGRAAAENVIGMLGQAKELNNKAYSGVGANLRAKVVSNLGGSKAADATVDLDNIMTVQALESLKATFGAAPTEGERKILMDIQASADKTPAQREAILDRAVGMAQKRLKFNSDKARSLRQGNYFADQDGAGSAPGLMPAGASGSWDSAPAAPVNRNVRVNF